MRHAFRLRHWRLPVVAGAITAALGTAPAAGQSNPGGATAPASGDGQLSEVVVTGHYQFLSADTHGTTNLPLPIEQVPQSIDLVSADFIQAANLKTLGDIASYTPGAINAGNPENNGTVIDIRGFPAGRAIDGIDTISSYVAYEPDFAIFDRLEVVEGPSSVVYGISSPGGLVNYVTKSATSQTPNYLYAQFGSWNSYRLEGQVAQALDSQGRVRVIGVAALDDGDSFTNDLNHHKAVVYGGINADISDSLRTYLHAGYEWYTRPSFDGIPTLPDGSPAPVSNSLLVGSRDIRIITKAYYASGDVTWKPNDVLEYNVKGNYENTGLTGGNEYGYGLQSNGEFNFNVTQFDGAQRTVNYGVGASSVIRFDSLGLKDSFVSISALYQDSKEGTDVLAPANQGTANIFAGQGAISQAFNSLYFGPLPYPYVSDVDTRTVTYSAQSVTKVFDRLSVLLGASYSKPEVDTTTNGAIQNYDFSGQVSYRGGLTYEFLPKAYAYVSYSESFDPQPLLTVAQTVLPPLSGKQYEAGIKYRPSAGLLLTGALYRIVESNVGQYATSINGVDFYAPIGQVTNKGFEIKALGQFTKNWQINAGYSYLDPRITGAISTPGNSLAATVGQTQLYLPKQTFSLYSTYTLPDGSLRGLSLGGGIRHIASEQTAYESALANSEEGLVPTDNIPAYTLVDLNLGYDFGPWTARLIVSNMFDAKYFINNYQTLFYGNAPGAPTNFSLTLRRTF
jgi:iron complex outermembrane receptor protein